MDGILADLFAREPVGRLAVELAQLAEAGVISGLDAGIDGREFEIIGGGF